MIFRIRTVPDDRTVEFLVSNTRAEDGEPVVQYPPPDARILVRYVADRFAAVSGE